MTQDDETTTVPDARAKEAAAAARYRRERKDPAYLRMIDDALERARDPDGKHLVRSWRYR